jgi:hypothetical protein
MEQVLSGKVQQQVEVAVEWEKIGLVQVGVVYVQNVEQK